VACSSFFGEHADAGCYPRCRPAAQLGLLFSRPFGERPQQVDITACPNGTCGEPVRVSVGDATNGGAVDAVQSGRFRYSAYTGGDWPAGDVVASVECAGCDLGSGDYVDLKLESIDRTVSFEVRATIAAVTVESSRRGEASFESDCTDVSRRQCQELRPSYEELAGVGEGGSSGAGG
jgi:hypothetical protein